MSATNVLSSRLLAITIFLAPLLLAGVHVPVNYALFVLLIVAFYLTYCSKKSSHRLHISLPFIITLFALAFTFMQTIPIPNSLIRHLSPKGFGILKGAFSSDSFWAPLSMNPSATSHEVIKLAACFIVVCLSMTYFQKEHFYRKIWLVIASSGVVVTLLGYLHLFMGIKRPFSTFGLAPHSFPSTFINSNHMAAFLGVGSILACGMTLTSKNKYRYAHIGALCITVSGVFLTDSRSSIIFLLLTLTLLALFLLAQKTKGDGQKSPLLILVSLLAIMICSFFFLLDVQSEISTISPEALYSKTQFWIVAPQMLHDFFISGIGRSALPTIYAHYAPAKAFTSHFENEWIQMFVDWGAPTGALLLLGVLWTLSLVFVRKKQDPKTLISLTVLFYIGLQNTLDFSLTTTAVLLSSAVFLSQLGAWVGEKASSFSLKKILWGNRVQLRKPSARILFGCLLCMTTLSFMNATRYNLNDDTNALRALLANQEMSWEKIEPLAAEIVRRHPTDSFGPMLIAIESLNRKNSVNTTLRWTNRAMFLAPSDAITHYITARTLRLIKVDFQTLNEYRLSIELSPSRAQQVAKEVYSLRERFEDVAALAQTEHKVRYLIIDFLIVRGQAKLAMERLEAHPDQNDYKYLERKGRIAVALQQYNVAQEAFEEVHRMLPKRTETYLHHASCLLKATKSQRAIHLLHQGIKSGATKYRLLERLVEILLNQKQYDQALEQVKALLYVSSTNTALARAYTMQGNILEKKQEYTPAIKAYHKALEHSPSLLKVAIRMSRLRKKLGQESLALAVLQKFLPAHHINMVEIYNQLEVLSDEEILKDIKENK